MQVDRVITLANGKKYLLLLEDDTMEDNYFLSVAIDENNEPTNEYIVLQEINKNGKTFTKKVNDPLILNQLLEDYRNQYNEEYNDDNNN